MRVLQIMSESDPALSYWFEADDSGTVVLTLSYDGEAVAGGYRLVRQTTVALLHTLRQFLEQADTDEESMSGHVLRPGGDVRAESRVVRTVKHELAVQITVVPGLTVDLRLSAAAAAELHEGLGALVPLRASDAAA